MLPASCRYYPSCSEYAKWQFEFNTPHKAIWQSSLRILRCNQLFVGGIDYPLIRLDNLKPLYKKITVVYWIVPKSIERDNKLYYIIKDFDVINEGVEVV